MKKDGFYIMKKSSDGTEKVYTKEAFRKDSNKNLKKVGLPELTNEQLEQYWNIMNKAYFQKYVMEKYFKTYIDINDVINFWWKD